MPDSLLREQRRFSAVLLHHPELTDHRALRKMLGASIAASQPVRLSSRGWNAQRFEYLWRTSLYPDNVIRPDDQQRDGGFAHEVYAAYLTTEAGETPTVLLASPYVRLLTSIDSALKRTLRGPALQYGALEMDGVYRYLSTLGTAAATRVTLQILNEPGLELVSLSGKNPLHSELHAALTRVAAPYAVRVEAEDHGISCRVNLDRHGNMWWYQATEAKLSVALSLLSGLKTQRITHSTRHFPLSRAGDE